VKNKETHLISKASTKMQAKRRKPTQSLDEGDDDDAECSFCGGKFYKDRSGEQWIKCLKCLDWCYEDCAGVEALNFVCDLCKK